MKVYVLVSDERVIAIHATREGAEAHRANYLVPSWVDIEEWELED
jgi:hypothetical protein